MPVIPKRIDICGRRWFRRGYGGTYHTVKVWVDGELVHVSPEQYGYGEQYAWTAREWLKENGYVPGIVDNPRTGSGEPLWRYCERVGCEYASSAEDVRRERDLHAPMSDAAAGEVARRRAAARHRRLAPVRRHGLCEYAGTCVEHAANPAVDPCR